MCLKGGGHTLCGGQPHTVKTEVGLHGRGRIQQGKERAFQAEGIAHAKHQGEIAGTGWPAWWCMEEKPRELEWRWPAGPRSDGPSLPEQWGFDPGPQRFPAGGNGGNRTRFASER